MSFAFPLIAFLLLFIAHCVAENHDRVGSTAEWCYWKQIDCICKQIVAADRAQGRQISPKSQCGLGRRNAFFSLSQIQVLQHI